MTPALSSGAGRQADRFNYNMWFSFDCSFAIPKPPSLIFFHMVLWKSLFSFLYASTKSIQQLPKH